MARAMCLTADYVTRKLHDTFEGMTAPIGTSALWDSMLS